MAQEQPKLPHKLTLNERKTLAVSGVTEVVSFDENTAVLRTSLGMLVVHGTGLHLKTLSLDGGQVAIDGTVSAMIYEEARERRGFFARRGG